MSGNGGWANPLPAGLTSLSVACFTFYALLGGKVNGGALPLLGGWLIGAFVVQVVVAVIELKEGALNGGNVFLFFSAFFCLTTGLNMYLKYFVSVFKWTPTDARLDGWAWVALGIVLIPISFCYFKKTPLSMNLMVICLDIVVLALIMSDLNLAGGHHTWAPIGSYCCLGAGIFALYTVGAVFLNTNFEKTILPMPGPMIK